MTELKHDAVEAAERIENGEDANHLLSRLSRAELMYVAARVGTLDNWDEEEAAEEIHGESANATVSRDQIRAVVDYVAEHEA